MSPRKAAPDEAPVTVRQAAAQMGLDRSQVYELIYAGKLEHIQYDGRTGGKGTIRITPAVIKRYMDDHTVPAVVS